ncbi:MAG: hypothetical protein LUF85_02615 [Bacteroides sp.]|nr:hypothetical protein [Bacteroides sp.]
MRTIFSFLSLAVFLVACSDDSHNSGTEKDKEGKSVYLKIDAEKSGKTRADEATATGTSAVLWTALIYFLDGASNPQIYATRTVGSEGEDITVEQLEAGYMFEGIPSSVTQVYVVGNYNTSDGTSAPTLPTTEGLTLSQVQAVVWNIQQVSYGSFTNGSRPSETLVTVMDGISQIQSYDTNPGGWNGDDDLVAGAMYADVVISPIVARIEIERITYEGDYMSFTLEGIYINYYYARMPLSLDRNGFSITNNGSTVAHYDRTSGNTAYAYTDYSTLEDYIGVAGGTSVNTGESVFEPANGVWAYQVFGNSNPVPHIILKLKDVVDANGTYVGDRYVTVTGFLNGSTPVTTFERNTIYKITDLVFDNSDTSLVPEPDTVNLWVHVSVDPWNTVIVTPVIE